MDIETDTRTGRRPLKDWVYAAAKAKDLLEARRVAWDTPSREPSLVDTLILDF